MYLFLLLCVCKRHRKARGLTTCTTSGSGQQVLVPARPMSTAVWVSGVDPGGFQWVSISVWHFSHSCVRLRVVMTCGDPEWEIRDKRGWRQRKLLLKERKCLGFKKARLYQAAQSSDQVEKREQAGASSNLSPGGPGGQIGNPVHSFFFPLPFVP